MLQSRTHLVRLFMMLLVSIVLLAHGTAAAQGGDIVVGDGTPASCTETALRQALAVASASGGGTIRFDCGSDPLAISLIETAEVRDIGPILIVAPDGTTIDGGGVITLAGLANGIVLFVAPETAAAVLRSVTVTHRGTLFPTVHNQGTLTITNSAVSDNRSGGGIVNDGTLTITGSTIARNGSFLRGGITNSGRLTLNDSVVSGNRGFAGGGLVNDDVNADARIAGSTFLDNAAEGDGGISNSGSLSIKDSEFVNNRGIFGDGAIGNAGRLDVKHSTFGQNLARQGGAGGIGNGGTASVADSEFSMNAGGFGAAISHTGGTLTIKKSDFSGNRALISGGGIYNCAGTVDIKHSTITGNSAGQQGGGIYTCAGSTTTLKDTLVRDNTPDDFAP